MASLQKNPGRLMRQIRQQPDEELWRKWAHEMREELASFYDWQKMLPIPGSRLRVVDKHRRMFDARESNPQEAIMTPDADEAYWKALAAHPGAGKAKPCDLTVWEAFEQIKDKMNKDYIVYA